MHHDSGSLVCQLATCAAVGAAATPLGYPILSMCRSSAGAHVGRQPELQGNTVSGELSADHRYMSFPADELLACCLPEGQV